ncbi:hypothetical protein R3P38DRAFT_346857 [Favolaschia claudopus]|uniref:Homeodomain-like domain-containing protein n=1 Tax=Favolaschia claudopus TaxID=2862362 RepID=A0AAW0CQY7_9AGAR
MSGNRRHIPKEQKDLIVVMAHHKSATEIADETGISLRTVQRVLRKWRQTGSTVRIPIELGRPRILTALEVDYLEGLVLRTPDVYTRGYTRKTISRSALEASPLKRLAYQAAVGIHPARRLVFLDESACNRHTAKRLKAWAPVGERARRLDFFVRGIR